MLKLCYVNPECRASLESAGLLCEQAILGWNRGEKVVRKDHADVFRTSLEGIGAVYFKRYHFKLDKLIAPFQKNDAIREYENSAMLQRMGISQAEPILAGLSVGWFGTVRCGFFMMREIAQAESLDKLLTRMQDAPDDALLAAIADELTRMLTIMHRRDFCHWDFKPRNILVAPGPDGVTLTPIDTRAGRIMRFYNRRFCIARDYRFLLREPLLKQRLKYPE